MVAGDTAIATVGLGNGLNYRGYNVEGFAKNKTKFEEVIYLLLVGELPTAD
jgi:2-methylcitrate synthase